MSDTYHVYFVFEDAPTAATVEHVVAASRDEGVCYPGRDLDPDVQADAEIAAALLADGPLADRLAVGHEDVGAHLRLSPTGASTPADDDVVEGARDHPHATLSVTDGHFYPMQDEADGEAAVLERTDAFLSLVAHVHEAFAAAGHPPTHTYAPHPATEQELWDPSSAVEFDASAVLETVPPMVFWLQVYAPDAVAALGEAHVLDAPAPHVRQLADGSVLVAAYETPTLYTSGQHTTAPVADHLGVDGD